MAILLYLISLSQGSIRTLNTSRKPAGGFYLFFSIRLINYSDDARAERLCFHEFQGRMTPGLKETYPIP